VQRLWQSAELPVGFTAAASFSVLLVIGALAAGSDGAIGPITVLCLNGVVVLVATTFSPGRGVVPLAALGWLFTIGFSAQPYAQLQPGGWISLRAAALLPACGGLGYVVGYLRRDKTRLPFTLSGVHEQQADYRHPLVSVVPAATLGQLLRAVNTRRQLGGALLGGASLPLLTVGLVAARSHLTMADTLLVYLLAVVAVTLVGGFWPGVASAAVASLLANWYFTAPLHTFAIDRAQDVAALVLFVTIAVCISAVVHLAAREGDEARRSRDEADILLELARTVLSGSDSPEDILDHLVAKLGGSATLLENVGGTWNIVGRGSSAPRVSQPVGDDVTINIREGLRLRLERFVPTTVYDARLVAGFAAQAAAALDRQRLRTQAEQAEVLAAGNRMRTALLAAVSHDLRTPLSSVKAAVSSLRQTDIEWSAEDEAELLATIEESADRLASLIENLLDMSRVQTGALQPILRAVAIDEVAPVAVRSVDSAAVVIDLPEDLPLVRTDAGLLERVLANLVSNALRFSAPGRPPTVSARCVGQTVEIRVVDHGPGVPPEARSTIFEPFQRLGDQPAGTGVGLGLAVAKGFTEAMGGSIRAETTDGGGLTMVVTLRVQPAASVAVSLGSL